MTRWPSLLALALLAALGGVAPAWADVAPVAPLEAPAGVPVEVPVGEEPAAEEGEPKAPAHVGPPRPTPRAGRALHGYAQEGRARGVPPVPPPER